MIKGDRAVAGHGDAEKLLIRLLETLNWYDLLGLFSPEELAQKLVGPTIRGIYPPEKRARYERLGKILRGEAVTFTKWVLNIVTAAKTPFFLTGGTALSLPMIYGEDG